MGLIAVFIVGYVFYINTLPVPEGGNSGFAQIALFLSVIYCLPVGLPLLVIGFNRLRGHLYSGTINKLFIALIILPFAVVLIGAIQNLIQNHAPPPELELMDDSSSDVDMGI